MRVYDVYKMLTMLTVTRCQSDVVWTLVRCKQRHINVVITSCTGRDMLICIENMI